MLFFVHGDVGEAEDVDVGAGVDVNGDVEVDVDVNVGVEVKVVVEVVVDVDVDVDIGKEKPVNVDAVVDVGVDVDVDVDSDKDTNVDERTYVARTRGMQKQALSRVSTHSLLRGRTRSPHRKQNRKSGEVPTVRMDHMCMSAERNKKQDGEREGHQIS